MEFSVKSQQTQAIRHHDHDKLAEKAKFRRQLLLFGMIVKKICSKIIFLHTVLLGHTTTIQYSAAADTTHSQLSRSSSLSLGTAARVDSVLENRLVILSFAHKLKLVQKHVFIYIL